MSINDPLNAFCRYDEVAIEGSTTGPLLGCSFAVKDVFDIAGHRTGNGHPLWLETHPPAQAHCVGGRAPARRRSPRGRQDLLR